MHAANITFTFDRIFLGFFASAHLKDAIPEHVDCFANQPRLVASYIAFRVDSFSDPYGINFF